MSATIACTGVLRTPKELRSGVAKRPQGGCAAGPRWFTANSQQADLGHRPSTLRGEGPSTGDREGAAGASGWGKVGGGRGRGGCALGNAVRKRHEAAGRQVDGEVHQF